MVKIGIKVLPWLLVFILASALFWVFKYDTAHSSEEEVVVNHHMVVEKINSLGKLELVKFYLKDIIEHKVVKEWLPDPKVVLIASGEVVGCIDLNGIGLQHIFIEEHSVTIQLPDPEICYFKINHKESKVYNIEYHYFQQAELIDAAYKNAEQQMEKAALKMDIISHTKVNAELFLKPILESFTGKKIIIKYASDTVK
ncbi:MAG: DUF4230 domain-containing protein [Cytophagaceae bacterium]